MYFTVFTPTYNRAYILGKAYQSLVNQTFKDFRWVIVDDGSQDNTEELVNVWKQEAEIDILYIKQENKGRFSAYNTAMPYFEGELVTFLDSDDRMKPEALEEFKKAWEERDKNFVPVPIGIIYYMEKQDGKIHGNELPDLYCDYLTNIRGKYKVNGDKGQVYRRATIENYPYPVFSGEKFIGDSLIFNRMSKQGGMIVLKKSLYVREYPEDSLTKNIDRVHYHSPRGMALYYKETMSYYKEYLTRKINCAMKYVAFSRIAHQKIFTEDLDSKTFVVLMYLPGIIYSGILKRRVLLNNKKG